MNRPLAILERALPILRDAVSHPGATVREISQRTDIPRATVWRWLRSLRDLDVVCLKLETKGCVVTVDLQEFDALLDRTKDEL